MGHDMATALVRTHLQADGPCFDIGAPLSVPDSAQAGACATAGAGCDRCAQRREWDAVLREVVEIGDAAAARLRKLSPRQQEIMQLVIAGHPSKNIAADLGISQRTVENHRAAIMDKAGVRTIAALVRMEMAASWANSANQHR